MGIELEVVEGLFFLISLETVSKTKIRSQPDVKVEESVLKKADIKEDEGSRKALQILKIQELEAFSALQLYLEAEGFKPVGTKEMLALLLRYDPEKILQDQEIIHLIAPSTLRRGVEFVMGTVEDQWKNVGRGRIPHDFREEDYRIICTKE